MLPHDGQNTADSGIGEPQTLHREDNLTYTSLSTSPICVQVGESSLDVPRKRMKKTIATETSTKASIGLDSSPTKMNGKMKKNPELVGDVDNVSSSIPINTRNIPPIISRSGLRNSQSHPGSALNNTISFHVP